VTFTATVAPAADAGANPTGTVVFYDNGTEIGSGPVSTAAGLTTATLTTDALPGAAIRSPRLIRATVATPPVRARRRSTRSRGAARGFTH
jgi:hypothetical protein